jgi:hypothetical protein
MDEIPSSVPRQVQQSAFASVLGGGSLEFQVVQRNSDAAEIIGSREPTGVRTIRADV